MKDSLGDRMKGYESVAKNTFIKRMPVIIRLDGKSFSKYTKPLKSKENETPFNSGMATAMQETMKYLCENIQNTVLGYTQSDEITLVLKDWTEFDTQQWFGGSQSKIESVSASMATAYFNYIVPTLDFSTKIKKEFAMFDSRAFNIPKEDVTNNLIWRQKDCIRNSVSMLAQHHISHRELQGKSCDRMKDMLYIEHGVNWDYDIDPGYKYGRTWTKDTGLDSNIYEFVQNRNYIEDLL